MKFHFGTKKKKYVHAAGGAINGRDLRTKTLCGAWTLDGPQRVALEWWDVTCPKCLKYKPGELPGFPSSNMPAP
jgi:hypothetical protein